MADILRNLDRLAGSAGRVIFGERARREALLQGHLQRSQARSMQRQKAQDELLSRLKVQALGDRNAFERVERQQEGLTKRTEMEIAAGKYDKSRFSYLSRTLKLDPKIQAMLDVGETMYKENLDPLASSTSFMLTKEDRRKFHEGALLGRTMMTEAIQYAMPKLYEKIIKPL